MSATGALAAVAAAGGRFEVRGTLLRLKARTPLAPETVAAAFTEVREWHRRHREALAHHRTLHPEAEAAALAWGELQNRWHRLYAARVPERQCAGCGKPLGGLDSLALGDGTRVHFGDGHGVDCLLVYGERWRGAATRALVAMGLEPPPGAAATAPARPAYG